MLETVLREVPVNEIVVRAGHNPRKYFDPGKHNSLVASISAQGLVQTITLRPNPNGEGYELVAGERRWRAAIEAGLATVPALIRNYSDEQALAVAAIENQERDNISAAEEAQVARRALDAASGDKIEASRLLNWSEGKFEARLLLLHAESFVLEAVSNKILMIGHAELLSVLPADLQRTVFDKVIANMVTVDTLRTQLAQYTQDLSAAPFDTSGCKGCPHNGSQQASLFSFHVGDGRCSNRPCWEGKVEKHIDDARDTATTEFNIVFLDREKDPASYMSLTELGASGVGPEQFQACKGCSMFGAIILTAPGKQGTVRSPICFNKPCNTEKVATYQESLPAPTVVSASKSSGHPAAVKPSSKPTPKKGKASATQVVGSPKKVVEQIHKNFRVLAAAHATHDEKVRQVMTVFALRSVVGTNIGSSPAANVKPLFAMTTQELYDEQNSIILQMLQSHESRHTTDPVSTSGFASVAAQALRSINFDLTGAMPICKEFLSAHTKSGLESLLASAELYRSLEGVNEVEQKKTFKRLMSGKNAEIIDGAIAANHDYSNFIPSSVADAYRKLNEAK